MVITPALTNTFSRFAWRQADKTSLCRPTIINAYKEDLPDVATWFGKWMTFMFGTDVVVYTSKGTECMRVCKMLKPIKHSK